jgi:hypothetical protein
MSVEGSESAHKANAPQPPRSCVSLFAILEKSSFCQTVCKAKFVEKVFASRCFAKPFSTNLAERRNFVKTDFNGIEITTTENLKSAENLKSQKSEIAEI